MTDMPKTPAGWYRDPAGEPLNRWWDGAGWTAHTQSTYPGHAAAVQPYAQEPVQAYVPPYAPPLAQSYAPPPGQEYSLPDAHAYVQLPAHGYAQPYGQPGYPVPYGWRPAVAARPPVRTIADATRIVFQKYGTFEGRAGRPEFWYWTLLNAIIGIGALLLSVPLLVVSGIGTLLWFLVIIWSLAALVPSLAVTVRRLRDAGMPWGLIFIALFPYAGGIVLLILCAQPSKAP